MDDHSSTRRVAAAFKLPTRAARPKLARGNELPPAAPIRHCSRWGLPCRRRCRRRGGLLHHRFTLACRQAVCSLWRFPSGCPGRALPGTVALWSPDFPHGRSRAAIRPSAPLAIRCAGCNSQSRHERRRITGLRSDGGVTLRQIDDGTHVPALERSAGPRPKP